VEGSYESHFRYFPAAPVQLATAVGGSVPNGGAEAFMELQKALNVVGDYRLSSGCNTLKWAISRNATNIDPDTDYAYGITGWENGGNPLLVATEVAAGTTLGSALAGNAGSCCFAMAVDLETSNGVEISGLNAEEQSDIALIASWSKQQQASYVFEVYTYYDAMIILRENNVLELIQ